jgi:hypothetical protein
MLFDLLTTFMERTIPNLLTFEDPALTYFIHRDLLEEPPGDCSQLWELSDVIKILEKQLPDGSWPYPKRGKSAHPMENYRILQTYRTLGFLIEMHAMDRSQPAIERAAEFLFSHQTREGDIRGIFGLQYAPHYTAGILELLITAGYGSDSRIQEAFSWFVDQRQTDGGWAWPLRTAQVKYQDAIELNLPVQSDLSQPFSHALTAFIIRAYAVHPVYSVSSVAHQAGELLMGRFFVPDKYTDRRAADYWFKYQYPFWWGNLLTVLDSLSRIGFSAAETPIQSGLAWFRENQLETGFWPTGYGKGENADLNQAWVALAVGRMLNRFAC